MSPRTGIVEAAELSRAFDRSFAELPRRDTTVRHDFLAVKIGGDPYAVRISEIAGLYADKKITPVPARITTLLGIAAFRGVIVPVHDLRTLFGYASTGAPRWLVVTAQLPVALAFDGFAGHLRLSGDAMSGYSGRHATHGYVSGVVREHDHAWPIVDMAASLEAIGRAVQGV
jgi:purine-binding chemotaxis protein CheW